MQNKKIKKMKHVSFGFFWDYEEKKSFRGGGGGSAQTETCFIFYFFLFCTFPVLLELAKLRVHAIDKILQLCQQPRLNYSAGLSDPPQENKRKPRNHSDT